MTAERPLSWQFGPTLVRGMGYYTGQVFEMSHPQTRSSVAGGGRYDKLVSRSLDRDVPPRGRAVRLADPGGGAVQRPPAPATARRGYLKASLLPPSAHVERRRHLTR
jgi:ATP phosphoribosyltransferase regulatory subunit HisZ